MDSLLRRCLTDEEIEALMNDLHGGACGSNLSGLATTQIFLRSGYFWSSTFKDCVNAVKWFHPCHVFAWNMQPHPAPLHMIITIGPFTKWGVEFMNCNLDSARGNHHIIVAIDYFMKWEEAMPLSNPMVR